MATIAHERILSELDHLRLSNLLQRGRAIDGAAASSRDLETILDGAIICPSRHIEADIVTMYSQILFSELRTGRQRKLTLCYPGDADPAAGFVSVLAILFQPEASGDYAMQEMS